MQSIGESEDNVHGLGQALNIHHNVPLQDDSHWGCIVVKGLRVWSDVFPFLAEVPTGTSLYGPSSSSTSWKKEQGMITSTWHHNATNSLYRYTAHVSALSSVHPLPSAATATGNPSGQVQEASTNDLGWTQVTLLEYASSREVFFSSNNNNNNKKENINTCTP